jgi:hypothetical protein
MVVPSIQEQMIDEWGSHTSSNSFSSDESNANFECALLDLEDETSLSNFEEKITAAVSWYFDCGEGGQKKYDKKGKSITIPVAYPLKRYNNVARQDQVRSIIRAEMTSFMTHPIAHSLGGVEAPFIDINDSCHGDTDVNKARIDPKSYVAQEMIRDIIRAEMTSIMTDLGLSYDAADMKAEMEGLKDRIIHANAMEGLGDGIIHKVANKEFIVIDSLVGTGVNSTESDVFDTILFQMGQDDLDESKQSIGKSLASVKGRDADVNNSIERNVVDTVVFKKDQDDLDESTQSTGKSLSLAGGKEREDLFDESSKQGISKSNKSLFGKFKNATTTFILARFASKNNKTELVDSKLASASAAQQDDDAEVPYGALLSSDSESGDETSVAIVDMSSLVLDTELSILDSSSPGKDIPYPPAEKDKTFENEVIRTIQMFEMAPPPGKDVLAEWREMKSRM